MGEEARQRGVPDGGRASGTGSVNAAPGHAGMRCVILSGRGLVLPARLVEGLSQRGLRVTVVADAPSVMLELANGCGVLIIHEPTMVRHLDELLGAVHRYYKGVACWRFDSLPTGQSSLARINGRNPGAGGELAAAKPMIPRSETVEARPVGTHATGSSRPLADATGKPPLISREELEMLLAPMPTDAPDGLPRAEPSR